MIDLSGATFLFSSLTSCCDRFAFTGVTIPLCGGSRNKGQAVIPYVFMVYNYIHGCNLAYWDTYMT